jgi:HEAT repeat protein
MNAVSLLVAVLLCPAAQKPEPKYEGKPLAYWIEKFQKAETDEARNAAEAALCAFGPDGAPAVPALMEMLRDRSPAYRARVAHILQEIGPGAKAAVPELVKRLKEKHAQKPREGKEFERNSEIWELLRIIGAIGPDAKEAILALVALFDDPDTCDSAVSALCGIGPEAKAALPAIRRAVFADPEKRPRYGISELHKLGPAAVPLLIDMLGISDWMVQFKSFEQLKKFDAAAVKGTAELPKLLRHEDPVTRYYAVVLSWKVDRNKDAIPVLAGLLREEGTLTDSPAGARQDYLAVAAAAALGEMGPDAKEALPALREAEAIAFVMWYFVDSRLERRGNAIVTPIGYSADTRASFRIMVGAAAEEAIRKITADPRPMR